MTRYGISTWILKCLPVVDAIGSLAAEGFEEVELSCEASPLVQAWERDPVGLRRKLAAAGMDVPSVHSPGPGRLLDVADEPARREAIEADLRYFALMKLCGIEEIIIHPTSVFDVSTEEERAARRAGAIESLKVLADHAGTMGIRMGVENLGRGKTPGSSMSDLLEMIGGLGDHVGLCFDVGHAEMAGLNLVHELRTATAAGKLFSLHIHDVTPEGKDHFIPGEGRIRFDALLTELNVCGFCGHRTLEISPPEGDVVERLHQVAAVRQDWER